jgi:hypothetical protein
MPEEGGTNMRGANSIGKTVCDLLIEQVKEDYKVHF